MNPTVALTYDDGPSTWTLMLLDMLAEHDARATFFVLGCNIAGRETVVEAAAAAGHEIGVHGWDHKPVDELTEGALLAQLEVTVQAIEQATGVRPCWWRPPWGRASAAYAAVAEREGLGWCGVTVDGRDVSRFEDAIVSEVLRGLAPGAVVGLHDGIAANGEQHMKTREATVRATGRILEHCRSVTVSDLLAATVA